jgi:hypothetical protein
MERRCSQCRSWKCDDDYSNNQWYKGKGISRCRSCVAGYVCQECYHSFDNPNELKMHMQVHLPRNVVCPSCGQGGFRSGANAVQHVESGYCTGCPGKSNARQRIYQLASSQKFMRPYITNVTRLTNGDYKDNEVPVFPYQCRDCNRFFKQCSQLLQHNDNKHGRQPLRLGY